uniref:OPA3-like protein n=1 Tax=Parascaris univalens TaxID=6257 RepID=A0A914ZQB6_PARUN
MGLPMIQVLMIAARQISRPIADAVIRYGRTHPLFRNRMLIPLGRGLAHLTTRLRMKNLGLGKPASLAPVSEETALEQASDFVQQLVLFSYSVGVFASYYFYTKYTTPETMKADDFHLFRKENCERLKALDSRLERIERILLRDASSKSSNESGSEVEKNEKVVTANRPRFKRISSLPVDEAAKVVLSEVSVLAPDDL